MFHKFFFHDVIKYISRLLVPDVVKSKKVLFLINICIRQYSSYKAYFTAKLSENWSLYEIPYIISYAKFSGESISGIINAKSSSIWPIFLIFSPAGDTEGRI